MVRFGIKQKIISFSLFIGLVSSCSVQDGAHLTQEKNEQAQSNSSFNLQPLSLNIDKSKGEWSLIVVPDTQHYSQNRHNAPISHMKTAFDWMVQMKDHLNIKMVQGLGDITESWSNHGEWQNSYSAWNKLEGKLPYMPVLGNHDDPAMMNRFFPVSRFSSKPWWGGDFGGIENNYFKMKINNEDYIFLHVESYDQYSDYRPDGLKWANEVLRKNPSIKVILATHDNWDTNHIREKLIKKHDNIVLSNAGHTCVREKYFKTEGPAGNVTHNFITDYQCDQKEVMLLRLYHFKPLEDKVQYYTFSPITGKYENDESSQGEFDLVQNDPDEADIEEPIDDLDPKCQTPYHGYPISIPGKLEVEDYDKGCDSDPAYYDTSSGNIGKVYRNDSVDIGHGEGGVGASIGWIVSGEWLEYTVDVKEEGEYQIRYKTSSNFGDGVLQILVNDQLSSSVSLPNTGGWDKWQEVDGPSIWLPEGKNILKLYVENAGFNMDWISFTSGTCRKPYKGSAIKVPGVLEAEDYDIGCETDKTYFDTTEENVDGYYREDAVDIGPGQGGGNAITWIKDGEWLEYTVDVAKDAIYQTSFIVSSQKDPGVLKIYIDGVEKAEGKIQPTGGWSTWKRVNGPKVEMDAGQHVMRVLFSKNGYNLDSISFIEDDGNDPEPPVNNEWNLIWADEFNIDGAPNPNLWEAKIDGNGGGNNELQYYSDRSKNLRVENGNLVIESHLESMHGRDYTSAKLVSRMNWLYGKIEVRAKLPRGKGTWPAIWMMPANSEYGIWPNSGEIDIMEHVGYDQDVVHSNIHTTSYNHMKGTNKGDNLVVANASDEFHVYSVEWDADSISFYVDGSKNPHFVFRNDNMGDSKTWPFNKNFYLILNIAVGGSWGGKHGVDNSIFSQKMEIDYVRVYKKH